MLLRHAASCGVRVYENTKATSILFEDVSNPKLPTGCKWESKIYGEGKISFNYLVDASGRAGIMSTQYLRNRHFNSSLKNVALWTYWEGGGVYSPGTEREGAPYFEALTGLLLVLSCRQRIVNNFYQMRLAGRGIFHSTTVLRL